MSDNATPTDQAQAPAFTAPGTLTPVLKRLESAGLVKRARSRADEREVEISLTDRGRSLRNDALDVRHEIVCRLGMSEDEIGRLRREIDMLLDRLDGGEKRVGESAGLA